MPTLTLKSKYKTDDSLALSVEEFKDNYLFGVPVKDRNGRPIPDSVFEFNIKSSQSQLEKYLDLLFKKQVYTETIQFVAEDYMNWSYLRTTFPVVCPILIEGYLNTTKQVTYPKEWLSSKKSSDGILYHRNLYIVPAGNSSAITNAQLFTGIIPNLSYLGLARIPNYWSLKYVTGFDKIPLDLINIIGSLSAVNVFRISGDLIISPGISSFSLGIDGLSQSMTAKAYDSRIKSMLDDLTNRLLPQAKDIYTGFRLGAM